MKILQKKTLICKQNLDVNVKKLTLLVTIVCTNTKVNRIKCAKEQRKSNQI